MFCSNSVVGILKIAQVNQNCNIKTIVTVGKMELRDERGIYSNKSYFSIKVSITKLFLKKFVNG